MDAETQKAVAPTGRLRVGIAVGTAISATWAKRDPTTRQLMGPTVDLANIFAQRTGLPLALIEHASSGEIIQAALTGSWDVSFTPVDDERKVVVDFGPTFALSESTYMVPKGSSVRRIEDVDKSGTRVFGVENTATIRSARRSLKHATITGVVRLDEVLARFRDGDADAIALGKESLLSLLPEFPGARILDGHFLATGTALAVPRGNAVSLNLFGVLLEELKTDGTVRKILDRHGMTGSAVAPPGLRS